MDREAALDELRRGAGRQFDPEVVEALLDLLGEGAVALSDCDAAA
jgi:HD-GYP domain-containing protein (c-di-GMP phosphodiesterase class II)